MTQAQTFPGSFRLPNFGHSFMSAEWMPDDRSSLRQSRSGQPGSRHFTTKLAWSDDIGERYARPGHLLKNLPLSLCRSCRC
jgi:hypothetical protein